ncbi:ABC transporter A family member 7-like isoform X2 [Cucumis melo]|uniref:ABC transporter A family member 7-like isoform X2 n=1 Tax=Cucumis melo TaxID=3656 RepID=A0ABM3KEE7_CUCME|nr:ABC transporter A family member 7-like isoform X2 [Cucumis melo]
MSFGFRRLGDAPRATPFWTQANALLIKNLTYQKRNLRRNISLISFPIILCSLLAAIQTFVDKNLDNPDLNCGCACVDKNGDGKCEKVCGIEYSSSTQAPNCPNPSPPRWAPILQMPAPDFRAVRTDFFPYTDLPNESCRESASCPVTMLFTGKNRSLGNILAGNMVPSSLFWNSSDAMNAASLNVLGSEKKPTTNGYLDSAFFSSLPLYYILRQCVKSPTVSIPVSLFSLTNAQKVACVQGLQLWRNSSSQVNDEIYRGYINGNPEGKINEILSGFDFLNSDRNNFNVTILYNSSYKASAGSPNFRLRVPRLVNLVSNGYLKFMLGAGTEMPFQFVKEMPKHETKTQIDFSSNLGALFFTWVILQPFPVILTSLVSEKQQKLRIMMKMHGLGDGPYWMISYAYFLTVYAVYMFCFVMFGSVIGLDFFTMNDYGIQLVFYLLFINVLVSVAFLMAGMFSDVKTAEVSAYIGVFGTGLLGGFLFQFFIEDPSFPHGWLILMELYPGFMLYRGLYEFAFFSVTGKIIGTSGMQWGDLTDSTNGMGEILIIMLFEWIVVLLIAYYIDQVLSSGKHPLFFLQRHDKKTTSNNLVLERQRSKVVVQIDKHDVREEREKVERLLNERHPGHGVICDHLKKVYPGRDGNPEKFAVKGLSLAIDRGECFGMLGPNGAGKTSFISMMIGLTKPTAGTAFVEGLDIRTEMNAVYESMGVCPQHDLLWDNLTGREHLLFYGRLKSLKGSALIQAVEESLKEVNLFKGGVADKQAGMYSGGMKRRLSVAISLIGDPKVVYMDEPSTGLDPASRKTLWNAVKRGKQDRAIILTTHSMEEAEVLCDRIGIFVDGCLQCVGHPKELKARYGGVYVFTMTTSAVHEGYVEDMVKQLAPGSNKIYHLSGTQKFELPKHEVRIADVFLAVEKAKSRFAVLAWGLSDTTLEDVFIKVAKGAKTSHMLS